MIKTKETPMTHPILATFVFEFDTCLGDVLNLTTDYNGHIVGYNPVVPNDDTETTILVDFAFPDQLSLDRFQSELGRSLFHGFNG